MRWFALYWQELLAMGVSLGNSLGVSGRSLVSTGFATRTGLAGTWGRHPGDLDGDNPGGAYYPGAVWAGGVLRAMLFWHGLVAVVNRNQSSN